MMPRTMEIAIVPTHRLNRIALGRVKISKAAFASTLKKNIEIMDAVTMMIKRIFSLIVNDSHIIRLATRDQAFGLRLYS
jgi:hypothetical protein